jgi:hypothetical protein
MSKSWTQSSSKARPGIGETAIGHALTETEGRPRRRNFLQFTHTFPYTDQEQRGYSSAHSGCFARAARDATARRDPASTLQGERDVEISYSDSEILAGPAKRKR